MSPPMPGTAAARKGGCTCPARANQHPSGDRMILEGCPMHDHGDGTPGRYTVMDEAARQIAWAKYEANRKANPAPYGDRNERHKNGTLCDKAWHLDIGGPVAATHVARCADCPTVYARCNACNHATNVRESMRAHRYGRHSQNYDLKARVLHGRRGREP